MKTQDAVKHLTSELKEDAGFYESYKANIAMAFVDEFNPDRSIHQNANDAADRFLKIFIADSQKEADKDYGAVAQISNKEKNLYNPTCFITGKRSDLQMYPVRNDKGEMIGWFFLNEEVNRDSIEISFEGKVKE